MVVFLLQGDCVSEVNLTQSAFMAHVIFSDVMHLSAVRIIM